MNRKDRRRPRSGWLCQLCHHRRGLSQMRYCAECIEETRQRYRCPDCASIVTILVIDGSDLGVDLRHDSTCPTWLAKRYRPIGGRDSEVG